MLASQSRRFGEALIVRHAVTRQKMEEALQAAADADESIDVVMRRIAEPSGKDLAAGHAAAVGIEFVDFDQTVVHADAAAVLGAEKLAAHDVLAIEARQGEIVVAFPMPAKGEAMQAVAELAAEAGYELVAVGADPDDLEAARPELSGGANQGHAHRTEPEQRFIELVEAVVNQGGSDLHLAADQPPYVRILGDLVPVEDHPPLSAAEVREMALSITSASQRERFTESGELDVAYAVPGLVRLRCNLFVQRGAVGGAFRVVPSEVVPLENLGLPSVLEGFADLPRGMVLVTGPTGSGKSTTLASMVDLVNRRRRAHIITIEDPIEFIHNSKMSLVNQREVGEDTKSFAIALKHALRQDPDVVMVGEMRDLDTISTAIRAAETGHLVFATLHTQDSAQTVDRIVDVFPAQQQAQVRTQLANSLQGIVSQQLVVTADGRRRVPAAEVLLATTATRSLIRDGKAHQLANTIASGRRLGMQTIDESLAGLVRSGDVTVEEVMRRARDPDGLARMLGIPSSATA